MEKTKDEISRIIFNRYQTLIDGDEEKLGLLQCIDGYYSGCWDKELFELAKLIEEWEKI